MFNWLDSRRLRRFGFGCGLIVALPLLASLSASAWAQSGVKPTASTPYAGLGRVATPAEVAAWDIDVRPDFKGIPKGAGSVAQGEKLWEAQCAACHGSFGENNQVFTAIVGYTTAADSLRGRVASLNLNADAPTRTSMMKVSQVSTLWDYINRAMPWYAPKTLQADEVYALTAYLLHLGNAIPADFVLSERNIAAVQNKLPNRLGTTTQHALWPGPEFGATAAQLKKPDVQGSHCMTQCKVTPKVVSAMPAYAMSAHGNLAEQHRPLGGLRGLDTPASPGATPREAASTGKISP